MIKWIKKRMNERTSWDGAMLMDESDDIVLAPLAKIAAGVAIVSGSPDNLEIRVIKNWV